VVGAGRVYAGGRDGVLYAYALSGNHTRWRVWADNRFTMTPTLIGTVAAAFSADGRLYGTDRNGTPMWKPSIGPATAAPISAAGTACVPLTDGSARCVRATDGAMMPRITQDGAALKSLAGNATLLFAAATDGSVGAWDPVSGRQRWLYRPQSTASDPATGSGGAGGGSREGFDGPARLLTRTGEVDVAYPDGHLTGLDARTGAVRWQYTIPEPLAAAPTGDDGGIFLLGASGTLYALRPPGIAAGLGSSPTVAPLATTRPPAGGEPPAHQQPSTSTSASLPSDPDSDPPDSDPPDSDPPTSDPPASEGPGPVGGL
jgi:outer membrane protein assembly factor BamB